MTTARQLNPFYKPLPALPTENSNSEKPISPINPVQGSSDLQLDSVSISHIRKILQQSLQNCGLSTDPLESTILGIIFDISETIPKAIETLHRYKITSHKIDEKDKDKNKKDDHVKSMDNDQEKKIENDPKFVIKLKKEEDGKITDSHFVYNFFDGGNLFKHVNDEDQESNKNVMKHWIGGTIIVKETKKYNDKIDKILELMVYVVCNLKLEVCLFKDNSILRADTKDDHDAEDVQNSLRNSRRTSKSSWLGWLMKNKHQVPNFRDHIIKLPEKYEKHGSLVKKLSTKRNSISKASIISTNTDERDNVINLSTYKFANAIYQMERTILSSSPGVKFPPPHLLIRLKEEETEIHTNLDGTFKSYKAKDALDLASDFSNGTINSNGVSTGKYRTYAISRSNQVSLDFRSGLSYLMTNNSSLNGVFKHQSLSCSFTRFWSPTALKPCHNHKIITMEYYNKSHGHVDSSLGEFIDMLCDKAYEVCQDATCDRNGIDHITTYTHSTGRISISLEESSDSELSNSSDNILMWAECKLCSTKTPIVQMSHATYLYSFGKYLELLFYNENFYSKNLCQHSESRESIIRYFRKGNLVVKIEYEHVDLFEMRLPKLQISHEETPTFNTLGEAEKIDRLFTIDKEDSDRLLNEMRLEITNFYGVVKQHITALEEYFDSISTWLHDRRESSTSEWVALKVEGSNIDEEDHTDYLEMLGDMMKDFRKEEFELYDILKASKSTTLNDIRKLLVKRILSTKKRLLDWQKKYVRENDLEKFSNIDWNEPEYADLNNCHVFPGSPIIIREDEPSSIIAFTLSSRDYLKELSLMRQNVRLSLAQSAPTTPVSEHHQPPQYSNSFSTLITSLKFQDSGINNDDLMDQYSSNIRRKYVKESPGNVIGDKIIESLNPFNLSLSGRDKKRDPEKDGEKLNVSKSVGKFGGIFGQKNDNSEKPKDENIESTFNEKQEILNEKVQPDKENKKPEVITDPEKETIDLNEKELSKKKDETSSTGFTDSFSWSRKTHKEVNSPHLKYQCTHGNKKFSCTVYFATQFDSLRRRCGIENICIDSLSRCSSWQVTGGKSSSTFFKTKDERLVIKQMVSSWRIGEKEAFLRFAPKYFEYMDKPPSKPSVLAKIFGFYTIKIKDTKKNNVTMKMDVLVMEHLFFDKTITRTFDLKGIQERQMKGRAQNDATLWDGDWVEGRYKLMLLIHSHSKKLIHEAIHNDTQFLTDSNIMDYSLLVGVDDEKKELVVGIVDFIGTYTLYKKIENKGKTIGRNAKEVTVIPPDQYKDRFRDSIDQYFLEVPDKWMKLPSTDDNQLSSLEEPSSPISLDSPISTLPSVL